MQRTPAASEYCPLPIDEDTRAKLLAAHRVMTDFSCDFDLQVAGIPPGHLAGVVVD